MQTIENMNSKECAMLQWFQKVDKNGAVYPFVGYEDGSETPKEVIERRKQERACYRLTIDKPLPGDVPLARIRLNTLVKSYDAMLDVQAKADKMQGEG